MQHAPTVDGVTLASLHAAKGLEWDAVFLVGLAEGTLPTTYAKTPERSRRSGGCSTSASPARASGCGCRSGRPRAGRPAAPAEPVPARQPTRPASERRASGRRAGVAGRAAAIATRHGVLPGLRTALLGGAERKLGRCATCPSDVDEELLRPAARVAGPDGAAARGYPAYVVFTDATLTALAERQPSVVTGTDRHRRHRPAQAGAVRRGGAGAGRRRAVVDALRVPPMRSAAGKLTSSRRYRRTSANGNS